jgi:hypothetical protein
MQIELTEAGAAGDESGFTRPRGSAGALMVEADRLMQAAWHGTSLRARADLQEAMASGDFRNAAFEVIDREMLERYGALPATWTGYARRVLVRDFKKKRMVDLLGGLAGYDKVPELDEYPERKVSKAGYYIQVSKRGARFAFSWESWVNDELQELESLPEALAIAGRESESREAVTLLTDTNGPNDTYFNATAWGRTYDPATDTFSGGSSNLMTGNPALSSSSLQAAIQAITSRKDPDGRPVAFPRLALVVPPALEVTARAILNATQIELFEGAVGNGQRKLVGPNWLSGAVELVVEPWLTVTDAGANAATTWYVVPSPNGGRPALGLGFLRGHETPQVRVKKNQGTDVAGGELATTDGGFEIDDIQYRGRHVLGSGVFDMIGTIVSNGSGS